MINYNYLLEKLPGVTVIMIDSGRSKKWIKEAQESVFNQVYPLKKTDNGNLNLQIELKVMINHEKTNTIGYCWNKMIKEAKFDHIFILDDDDKIEHTLLFNLMLELQILKLDKKNKDIIGITPYVTFLETKDGKPYRQFSNSYTSGLIEKEWLLKIPFREDLPRKVDMRWDDAIAKENKYVAIQRWNHGYIYRQHDQMVSGRNIDLKYIEKKLTEVVDIEVS